MMHTSDCTAMVLERELPRIVNQWIKHVDKVPELMNIPLNSGERSGHLHQLLHDIIGRLQPEENNKRPDASPAHNHGKVRFQQGYNVTLLLQESRLLETSIDQILHLYQKELDFNVVLERVKIIADECDTQLKHTVEGFIEIEKQHREAA